MRQLFLGILIIIGTTIYAFGLYPVAMVGRAPIAERFWRKAFTASLRLADTQTRIQGIDPGTRSKKDQNTLRQNAQRDALSFLIEDRVLRQEGPRLIGDFETKAAHNVESAISQNTGRVESAAQTLYGLDLESFKQIVLLPQERRNLFMDSFQKRNASFEDWFASVITAKKVQLFFVPFHWSGTSVE